MTRDPGPVRKRRFMDFFRDRRGATAIEYAIIGGSLSIVIATLVFSIGDTLETTFQAVDDGFE